MPRAEQIPSYPSSLPAPEHPGETRTYRVTLITPLFGGGVEAGINDPVTPIRGKTIRGHLQFWWRATRGAAFSTTEDLHRRQSDIWGTTERASPVQLAVLRLTADQPAPCAKYKWNLKARRGQGGWDLDWLPPFTATQLSYVLFPFQGKPPVGRNAEPERSPAACFRQVTFELHLRAPSSLWIEVETALWAWINFGGIGSRTRRGCGTLSAAPLESGQRTLVPASIDALDSWWGESVKRYGLNSPTGAGEWPILIDTARPGRLLWQKTGTHPIEAWDRMIRLFRHFRQGVNLGRDPGTGSVPGRSRFPEPESIRKATGTRSSKHARLPFIPEDAFPRAELGLPIIFHFKSQDPGEPPETALYPVVNGQRQDRMASPLILKPLALADGKCVPLVVHLLTPDLQEVELTKSNDASVSYGVYGQAAIRDRRLALYPQSPLRGSSGGSAIEAFLQHARTEGFV